MKSMRAYRQDKTGRLAWLRRRRLRRVVVAAMVAGSCLAAGVAARGETVVPIPGGCGRLRNLLGPSGVDAGEMARVLRPCAASIDATVGRDGDLLQSGLSRFASTLKMAGEIARGASFVETPQDVAEGYRHLSRLSLWWIESTLMGSDPSYAFLQRTPDPRTKWGLDNPDNLYHFARIRDDAEYLITGTRGSPTASADLNFQVLAGLAGTKVNGAYTVGGTNVSVLPLRQLQIEADGSYQIIVGSTPRPGNWLPTKAGADVLAFRETFADWDHEVPGMLHLERIDSAGKESAELTPEQVAANFDAAATGIAQEMFFWTDFVGTLLEVVPKNGFPAPRPTQDGLPGQFSALGQFDIGDDEALVVTLVPTDARYQGFMVGNLWFESFEYANRQSSLTSAQAELGSDGLYHYVVSATDPAVANWLDTEGHHRGLMFLRWQGLGAGVVPQQPNATLVKLADLRASLPADTRLLTPADRQAQIAARQRAVARRYEQ